MWMRARRWSRKTATINGLALSVSADALPPPSMREALATPIKLPSEKRLPSEGAVADRRLREFVTNSKG